MEAFWTLFCNAAKCSGDNAKNGCGLVINPYSCINQILVISIDALLLLVFLVILICKSCSSKKSIAPSQSAHSSPLRIAAASFNGLLSLGYFSFGIWIIYEKTKTEQTVLPLHEWLTVLFHGLGWLLLSLTVSIRKLYFPFVGLTRFYAVIGSLFAGFLFISCVWEVLVKKLVTVGLILDILSLPGAILLLLCVLERQDHGDSNGALYEPLQGREPEETVELKDDITPFAYAGLPSKLTFWWLNPLMKKGKHKILQEDDIPLLRREDRAETCYSRFMERIQKNKKDGSSDASSMLWAIVYVERKGILASGILALIKVLALATGPLFLSTFVKLVLGEQAFEYEGYALTAGLFLVKCLESFSERQWYFQTQLIGLRVRSFLSAAICGKQLKISNAAKITHSPGEIVTLVTSDAYRIGEFPYWFHQIWSTSLQLCLALAIVYYAVGLATLAALVVIILLVVGSSPLAKLQHKYQKKLMEAQSRRVKATTEALANMKVLKLYAWETHFKDVVEKLRKEESEWIDKVLAQKGYYLVLFWSSPILVPAVTFWVCYLLGISLNAGNVFTFLASLRIVQEPVRLIPDVVGAFIQAKVSFYRIVNFLETPELQNKNVKQKKREWGLDEAAVIVDATEISWDSNLSSVKATLRNVNLTVKPAEKVAICGEVGSGKSTLLATILGEVAYVNGTVQVHGRMAYVSQTAWIQTGTIQENILFGSPMESARYLETIRRCALEKDLEMLPFGDLTVIGERGVNLSGGQKQRIQLARALYQDADVFLLDDPFSAVDAHTATSLFNEYVMEALSGKTVLLVTHQVDFLPAFNSILLMSSGEILRTGSYDHLMALSPEFQDLVNAHNTTAGSNQQIEGPLSRKERYSKEEIEKIEVKESFEASSGDQLIKEEEREVGDTGLKPYIQYLKHDKGFLYFTISMLAHAIFIIGQLAQNYWLASIIGNSSVSSAELNSVYTGIGLLIAVILLFRSYIVVRLGISASESISTQLLQSLFRAPMSFYDSTPLGRILSRVSADLNIIDTDVAFRMNIAFGSTMNAYSSYVILIFLTWPTAFIVIPMIYLTIVIQKYYYASSRELMRLDGTTKSFLASHVAESIAGVMTIRAFGEEDRFFSKSLRLIDANASQEFHTFSAKEWLVQRLEILCAIVLSSSALAITLLYLGSSYSGFTGMALLYGLSLNVFLVTAVQFQCILSSLLISVERVEQYMHIKSEAPEVIEGYRSDSNWPSTGNLRICDLKVRYRPGAPLVLRGISCNIEGGHKVGIVGRTGSGKTTLISTLFRLVEPTEGKIIVDDLDICKIGLHDLRSHFGVIPQDPTLFDGTVRYNLDPLAEHTDDEIWKVLGKCQLREAVQEKDNGLNSLVVQDGSNWSMGQRQLFCLGRALLKRRRILVLDEATASIDNATDSILQRTIRTEFADCTVITVAHRVPTVVDCTMVLGMSDGKLVEYDEPMKLINKEGSLFGQLYKEYWFRTANASNYLEG
ncbi:ABC transporter C family member 10-like [Punica granatum]|uniref:ABC-type xenobiotic transporter n=2 Tax=Punica granatum TaxID=22663 RepID=A0A6P8DQM5_PUNGR|nr:ABC transporter C family member 10-like [Punica granatum]